MKKTIFVFTIFFFSFSAFAETEEPNAIKELRSSIRQLDLQITNLLQIIALQKKAQYASYKKGALSRTILF